MTPPMTQDESTSNPEVFLGPTGSETEEFYGYQRQNPGKDKSEYLKWFQDRFHKEIELRRRRSDQPSDLEYMVIKKRSKYRERIGEESSELIRYAETHPQKTYRELSEWFTDRFGKEIDITAISRALKRSRQESENGDSYDASPQPKRGRRSLDSPPKNGTYPGQQQPSRHHSQERPSMGSFSVASEISRNSYSPNNTPHREDAKLPTPEEPSRPPMQHYQPRSHPPPPQPLYSQVPPPVTQGPVWTSVNSSGGNLSSGLRAPSSSSSTYDPRPERADHQQQQPLLPAPHRSPSRMMRTPSMSSQSTQHGHQKIAPAGPQPLQPRPAAFNPADSHPAPTVPAVPPMAPRPYSPRKDMAMHLQTRFNTAIGENQRSMDEIRACQAEMVALIEDRNANDARFMQEHAKLLAERDRLQQNNDALKAWGRDLQAGNLELQTGNLELQQFQMKYDQARQHIARLEEENRRLNEENIAAREELQRRDRKREQRRLSV